MKNLEVVDPAMCCSATVKFSPSNERVTPIFIGASGAEGAAHSAGNLQ
ncbi:MAG: hypothetical protein GZ093_19430 [Rhodoferax sp.]|nr:hypothetical protein [Rhodoferax sp.]NDP40868.1 hypothetical protein [Rhodoferax sp.]